MCAIITTEAALQALRRIDRLEAVRRRVSRSLKRCTPGSELALDLARQRDELDEQVRHWRQVVSRAEACGFRIWSRADFVPGDFIEYESTWYEVLRVNSRSVTVPRTRGNTDKGIVRKVDGVLGCTWTVRYHDGITGRKNASEMAARENPSRPEDHEA